MIKKKQTTGIHIKPINILQLSVLFLIFLMPLLKGLFYKSSFSIALAAALVLFIIQILKSKAVVIDKQLTSIFVLQFIICLVNVFTGINKEDAYYGLLQDVLPFVVFMLLINCIKSNDTTSIINHFFRALFFSGTITALINIYLASQDKIRINHGLMRFEAVVPYANTLAVFMFAASIAGFYLFSLQNISYRDRILLGAGIILNLIVMVLTYSRIMWLLWPFLSLLFVIIVRRSHINYRYAAYSLSAFLYSFIISALIQSMGQGIILTIILAAPAIAFVFENCNKYIESGLSKLKGSIPRILKILIPIAAGAVLLAITAFKGNLLISRIVSININAGELQERFAYYRDSLKIIRDFPVFGTGAGGWNSIQYKYQTALYSVKYVHSFIIQAALDHGLAGVAVLMLQIALFLFYAAKSIARHKGSVKIAAVAALSVINAGILLHSSMDLDMDFPFINMIFWCNTGMLSILSGNVKIICKPSIRKFHTIFCTFATITLVLAVALASWTYLFSKGQKLFEKGIYQRSAQWFELSSKLIPFSSSSYFMQAQCYNNMSGNSVSPQIAAKCSELYSKAIYFDNYNPEYFYESGSFLKKAGMYEDSLNKFEQLEILQPLYSRSYESFSGALVKLAETDYDTGNQERAMKNFNRVLEIEDDIASSKCKLSSYAFKSIHKPNLQITPVLAYNIGISCYYLNKNILAENYLEIASKDISLIESIELIREKFAGNK